MAGVTATNMIEDLPMVVGGRCSVVSYSALRYSRIYGLLYHFPCDALSSQYTVDVERFLFANQSFHLGLIRV